MKTTTAPQPIAKVDGPLGLPSLDIRAASNGVVVLGGGYREESTRVALGGNEPAVFVTAKDFAAWMHRHFEALQKQREVQQ